MGYPFKEVNTMGEESTTTEETLWVLTFVFRPSVGAVMVTTGDMVSEMIVTSSVPVLPAESVAEALSVLLPSLRKRDAMLKVPCDTVASTPLTVILVAVSSEIVPDTGVVFLFM